MTRHALVDVEVITTTMPRSAFQENQIEQLANQILESEGLLKPLIVKKMGLEEYVLVDGGLEYYAAVRAREKDPRKGEKVNAFVISPQQEEIIMKQLQTLKQAQGLVASVSVDKTVEGTAVDNRPTENESRLERRIIELEEKQMQQGREFQQEIQELHKRFKVVEEKLNEQSKIEEKLNEQETKNPLQLLNELPEEELKMRLKRSKIASPDKKAKAIIKARNKKADQKFADYSDVVKSVDDVVKSIDDVVKSAKKIDVQRVTEQNMLSIIDDWSR